MSLASLKATFLYYGKASLHTFWQAGVASGLAFFGGSGIDIAHLPSLSVLEKAGGAAALAGAAAVLSYLKQLLVLPAPGSVSAADTGEATPASLLAASVVPAAPKHASVPDTGVTGPPRPTPTPPAA